MWNMDIWQDLPTDYPWTDQNGGIHVYYRFLYTPSLILDTYLVHSYSCIRHLAPAREDVLNWCLDGSRQSVNLFRIGWDFRFYLNLDLIWAVRIDSHIPFAALGPFLSVACARTVLVSAHCIDHCFCPEGIWLSLCHSETTCISISIYIYILTHYDL